MHRGVYVIGLARLGREGRWRAAVLASPRGSVISHLSAATLWALRPIDPLVIDVSVPRRSGRQREGLRVHRPRCLDPEDLTTRHGIPVTTVPRTIVDLADVLGTRSMERLLDEAEYLGLLDRTSLHATIERNIMRSGASRLKAILADHEPGTTRTRSRLEEAFFALVSRAALPQPEVNAKLGPWTIDFLWRAERLAVETDGARSHDRDRQRESDGARNAWLIAHDYRPLRLTWKQVTEREDEVLAALEAATRPAVRGPRSRTRRPVPRPARGRARRAS